MIPRDIINTDAFWLVMGFLAVISAICGVIGYAAAVLAEAENRREGERL